MYIADSGLACHLLGSESEVELSKSPFRGALFEGFNAAEIVKAQINTGRRREIRLIETKAGVTVTPAMTQPMRRLAEAWSKRPGARGTVEMTLVHDPSRGGTRSTGVAPGVRAVPWRDFVASEG